VSFFFPFKIEIHSKHGLSALSPGHFWDFSTSESRAKFQPAKFTHPISSPPPVTDSSRQSRTKERWARIAIMFNSLRLTRLWQLLRVISYRHYLIQMFIAIVTELHSKHRYIGNTCGCPESPAMSWLVRYGHLFRVPPTGTWCWYRSGHSQPQSPTLQDM